MNWNPPEDGAEVFVEAKIPEAAGCEVAGGCSGAELADGKLKALGASGLEAESAGLSSFLLKKLNPPPVEPEDCLLSGGFEASAPPLFGPSLFNEKPPKGLLDGAVDVLLELSGFAPNGPPVDVEPDVSFNAF